MSKQIELENPDLKQQINLIGRLEENNATMSFIIRKNIFACLFSVHNIISLSRHEQVCLMINLLYNVLYY